MKLTLYDIEALTSTLDNFINNELGRDVEKKLIENAVIEIAQEDSGANDIQSFIVAVLRKLDLENEADNEEDIVYLAQYFIKEKLSLEKDSAEEVVARSEAAIKASEDGYLPLEEEEKEALASTKEVVPLLESAEKALKSIDTKSDDIFADNSEILEKLDEINKTLNRVAELLERNLAILEKIDQKLAERYGIERKSDAEIEKATEEEVAAKERESQEIESEKENIIEPAIDLDVSIDIDDVNLDGDIDIDRGKKKKKTSSMKL